PTPTTSPVTGKLESRERCSSSSTSTVVNTETTSVSCPPESSAVAYTVISAPGCRFQSLIQTLPSSSTLPRDAVSSRSPDPSLLVPSRSRCSTRTSETAPPSTVTCTGVLGTTSSVPLSGVTTIFGPCSSPSGSGAWPTRVQDVAMPTTVPPTASPATPTRAVRPSTPRTPPPPESLPR